MKRNMRIRCLIAMLLLIMVSVMPGWAEEVRTKLFDLSINDGYAVTLLPVYEIRDGEKVYAQADEGKQLTVNAASASLKVKVLNKTDYFAENYKSVSYNKKPALTAGKKKKLKYTLTNTEGAKSVFRQTVLRPAKPQFGKVEAAATSLFKGNGSLKYVFNIKSALPVKCTVKIRNSAKKVVYSHKVGEGTAKSWTVWWDGRSGSDGSAATGDYVADGTYKMTVYLSYRYGKKNKTVKKTIKIAVKEKVDTTSNAWPWKVTVTGNDKLDYMAEQVCREVLTGKETEVKRAKKLFNWCAGHFTRLGNRNFSAWSKDLPYKMDVTSSQAKADIKAYGKIVEAMIAAGEAVVNNSDSIYPNCTSSASEVRIDCATNVLAKQVGDCLNMAWMYEILCRHAGLECDIIENNLPKSDGNHHFWNVVKVNGSWYECDVRIANARNNPSDYSHCLRGKKYMESVGPGNGAGDVPRYNSINQGEAKKRYMALYNKVSETDCPGR